MRRRDVLASVGIGLAATTAPRVASTSATDFTQLQTTAAGDHPSAAGSIRVDVVGTSVTADEEVRTAVDALDTAFTSALESEQDAESGASVGIRGYEVAGWQSEGTFATQQSCAAIEDAAEKLAGSTIAERGSVTAWLWDYNASWSSGRGIGHPWASDPDHQHPVFVDNVDNRSTRMLAYSTVHEVSHALCSTANGDANCDPAGYDPGPYEACAKARALTASWYRGHQDHTLGTVVERDGTQYRTPMAHQGDAYLAGPCHHSEGRAPYNWTFQLSRCTIEAMGHSWRHLEGQHGPEDHSSPESVEDVSVTVSETEPITVEWDAVSDRGDSELAYYGIEVRDYRGGEPVRAVPAGTKTVPAGTTSTTIGGLEPHRTYWLQVSAVDVAGNVARLPAETTFQTGSEVVDPSTGTTGTEPDDTGTEPGDTGTQTEDAESQSENGTATDDGLPGFGFVVAAGGLAGGALFRRVRSGDGDDA